MSDTLDHLILDSLLIGVFIVDAETRTILDLNSAASKLIGYSKDEIIGMNCFVNICQHGRSKCPVMDLGKAVDRTETTLVAKDGSMIPILKTARRIKIDNRDCIIESFIDITEQKNIEKSLRLSEEESRKNSVFLNTVINSLPHPFYVIDPVDYSIIMANDATGIDSSTKKITCHKITHHSDSPCSGGDHPCPLEEVKKSRKPFVTEHTHYYNEGNPRIYEVHGNPILDQDGELVQMIEFSIDITERKKALELLVESESMLRAMSEQAPIGIAVMDSTGRVIRVAGTWLKIFGISNVDDALNVNLFEGPMIPEDKMQDLMHGNSIKYESAFDFSWVHDANSYKCSRTGVFHLGMAITPMRVDEGSEIEQYLVLVQDITEGKEREITLQKSEAALNATGRTAKVGGWELDAKTLEVSWTEETHRIHEIPLDQKPSLEEAINFYHPDDRERISTAVQRALDVGEPFDMELRFITAKGKELWTHTIGNPEVVDSKIVRLVGTFQDITERKIAEENIRESEERYRTVVQAMQDIIFIHDRNDIYTQVYASDNSILTRPADEFIGKHVNDVVSPEIAKTHTHLSSIVRSTGQAQEYDYFMEIRGTKSWFTSVLTLHEDGESVVAVVRDITESHQAEVSLKQSEERYRRLIDVLPEGVIIGDDKETITMVNKAMGEILGVDSLDLIGRNFMDFVDPRYASQIESQTRRRMSGTSSTYDIRMIRVDGEPRDVHVSAIPQLNNQNEIEGAIGVISDITKQKKLEKDLRTASYELKERLKEIKAVSAASDLLKDINIPIEMVLDEILPIVCAGFQFPEITCGRIFIDVHEFSTSNYNNPVATISEEIWVSGLKVGGLEIGYLELRPESDDGPFLGEEVSMISQISVDLSQFIERQHAQQEIIQQNAKLDAVTRSTLDAIVQIDQEGLVQFWNPASERIFGYPEKEMLGQNLHDVIVPTNFFDAFRVGFEKFKQTGTGAAIGKVLELSGKRKNGTEFPVELSLTAIKLGDTWGAVGVIRDITERKQNEQERLLQQKELEIYTSLLRHDLNNDLAGIVGSLEVVKMVIDKDPAEAHQFLDSSMALTVRMGNLLAAVGRTTKFQDEPLVNMIREIAKLSSDATIGLEIQVLVDDNFKNIRISGGRLLPMVFENLFRNAAQHAGEMPKITVEISVSENQVHLTMSDDGPGVPDDVRNQLFERGTSTKEGGGLGLYLSKKIVEAVGGSIELMPRERGKGAQFEIVLPLMK